MKSWKQRRYEKKLAFYLSRPMDPKAQAWVNDLAAKGWPRHIGNAMAHFIEEGKTHVAAHLALEFMKQEEAAGRWPPKKEEAQ